MTNYNGILSKNQRFKEDKDLSIRELAQLLHMHRPPTTIMKRKQELPFELTITLAKFYDVSLDYIGGFTNNTTPPHKR